MNRPMILASLLAVAGVAIASNARATDANPTELQAQSDPSGSLPSYGLVVKKTAETKYERKWKWAIEKYSATKELYLKPYEKAYVDYKVSVTPSYEDAYWAVSGEITIYNPTYSPAKILGVEDVMTAEGEADIKAAVDCGDAYFPYKLEGQKTLTCTYYSELPNGKPRKNKATVKTDGYVAGGYGTADVAFYAPAKETDRCVDVYDDKYGTLGYVCHDHEKKSWEYTMELEPTQCGDYTYTNTAHSVAKDSQAEASAYHDVYVKVPCAYGCTRTQGYWKNHSEHGPAKYDPTWAKLPKGADTTYYHSGQTWLKVYNTPPKGNAYYNAAHQYMAAMLNVYAGADPTPVKDELKYCEEYFSSYKPGDAMTADMKAKVLEWAGKLDKYNNGQMGPQKCE